MQNVHDRKILRPISLPRKPITNKIGIVVVKRVHRTVENDLLGCIHDLLVIFSSMIVHDLTEMLKNTRWKLLALHGNAEEKRTVSAMNAARVAKRCQASSGQDCLPQNICKSSETYACPVDLPHSYLHVIDQELNFCYPLMAMTPLPGFTMSYLVFDFPTFLNTSKPSSRVVPAYPQLFCNSERGLNLCAATWSRGTIYLHLPVDSHEHHDVRTAMLDETASTQGSKQTPCSHHR